MFAPFQKRAALRGVRLCRSLGSRVSGGELGAVQEPATKASDTNKFCRFGARHWNLQPGQRRLTTAGSSRSSSTFLISSEASAIIRCDIRQRSLTSLVPALSLPVEGLALKSVGYRSS